MPYELFQIQPDKWYPVTSSNVGKVMYSTADKAVLVYFHTSNTTYRYPGSTLRDLRDMLNAGSKGRHVHRVLEPRFKGVQVG